MVIEYIVVIILLLLSGLFSGLTLGLMSLDTFSLKRKLKLGDKLAAKVYPLRKRGNLLLVTLLLGNVAVNSTLAVFLGSITSGVIAGLVATGLIVVFGEILPQSVFSRYALPFGARMTWLVWIFLIVLYPISLPLSWVLDKLLGGELPTIFSKKEFRLFLEEQKSMEDSDIKKHEFEILQGGLVFAEKQVKDVMTPRVNTFFANKDDILNKTLLKKIHDFGHSRIPVYSKSRDKVVGILYAKDLIMLSSKDKRLVSEIMRKKVEYVNETDKLDQVLKLFQKKKTHVFIVHDDFNGVSGIVTLEDVLEEIVGEIIDEFDVKADMREV
jgi:metal transporter CNNM